ncbi:tRNA delta(2)-isopentenylpyrophosphate transferase [Lactobacillus pasteurii DSM 23907 = CRBIP 24.76]|uniref:tRNA dimethylallyltransferase n=1 Tax=Lactobacillus pasteurii DSM 23907 = CRBIP 24.76 TaxID=1423790 RepID=I7JYQ9_9LACO|nr:tRNA (adenosine(37)-N6)-dimethylallyltransferase MiaA [Lactobacillus pasteurii]KRK08373.1 tRNA delta(2)-isopentenylpyrophosphate transferase [Lactobacillus pasteurii DSM 23907 = CRBIP 24.76]TDG75551.1 hypothetical protein C5L33_000436 [Lactobacillus pasteurii]CCI85770.1 tRNA dimethylallyltransferase [Lactobacillus pasteurii DSM 23907 = CRBIP 24.76]
MQKVLALIGPTAVGKTALAIKLAQKLNAEIISGDSMQIYQEVAIGTAKATAEEQKQVKHYLVDTQSVFEEYSVKIFVDQAMEAIDQISSKDKLPFLVGGTGFYVNALLNDMQLGEKTEQESSVDQKWEDFLAENGAERLWQELAKRDQDAADKIPKTDSRRALRALTVIDRTGEKFSKQQEQIKPRYDYLIIGLNSEREKIYNRINQRVDLMMEQGLLQEAEYIYQHKDQAHQVLQAIAYKEFFPYFEQKASLEECVRKLKSASRRYAKRQLTYFRNKLPVVWFDSLDDPDVEAKIIEKVEDWLNV